MAETPNCRNFPSCGKRHFGACDTPFIRSLESGAPPKPGSATLIDVPGDSLNTKHMPEEISIVQEHRIALEKRVATLEKLVDELLSVKRKRSKYMKFYMRRKRKELANE